MPFSCCVRDPAVSGAGEGGWRALPCAGSVLENLTRGLASPTLGAVYVRRRSFYMGHPTKLRSLCPWAAPRPVGVGALPFQEDLSLRLQGLAHRAPGTLCSLLNAAQAMSAPGWPEGCRGWGLSHSFSCGCMWQGPPRPQPATAPLSCHAAVAGTGVLVPLWLFSELKLLTVTSLQSQFT